MTGTQQPDLWQEVADEGQEPQAPKRRQRSAGEVERLTAEVQRLTEELDKMARSRDHWEKQVKGMKLKLKKAETANWQLQNRPSYAFSGNDLEEVWRGLVQLAHPDKHGNSELAQRITTWLLEHKPRKSTRVEPP